jgi:hypothetical protein
LSPDTAADELGDREPTLKGLTVEVLGIGDRHPYADEPRLVGGSAGHGLNPGPDNRSGSEKPPAREPEGRPYKVGGC